MNKKHEHLLCQKMFKDLKSRWLLVEMSSSYNKVIRLDSKSFFSYLFVCCLSRK